MKPSFTSIFSLALMAGATMWSTSAFPASNVANTKHNLSVTGPGTVKAVSETDVCVFCHVPHNASTDAPLWNRRSPTTGLYTPYKSSTTKGGTGGTMGQPNGTSLLCLSCHDGTIAPGELLSRGATRVPMAGVDASGLLLPGSSGNLGRDLSDDHPISFAYSAALATASGGELASPTTLTGKVKLDANGQMQCSSCHDPHDNTYAKFLVTSNKASALCVTCHTKAGWSTSSHAVSTKALSPAAWPRTSATSVADNGCENCHRPHSAGGNERLLNGATDDVTCFTCHGGTNPVASSDIKTVNLKSGHNVTTPGFAAAHDPSGVKEAATRHVVCSDCHNPHQANNLIAGTTTAASGFPILPSTLKGVRGVDKSGSATLTDVKYEYEVCFKCHGASTNKPAPTITRAIPEDNFIKKFQPTPPGSFHPVVAANSGANVTSLISPLTANSTITCSSCHNNDVGVNAGGAGPKGPHGSSNKFLLEKNFVTTDNTTEATTNLCYKCHSSTSITGNASGSFRYHGLHLGSGIRAPCSSCHDPHGVSTNKHVRWIFC